MFFRAFILSVALVVGCCGAYAAPIAAAKDLESVLTVDTSSMSVGSGTATLTIGALQWTNGGYAGDYKIKVFPYFLKNEKGKLAITVSDEALAAVNQGKQATVTGTSMTIGKTGRSRHIDAIVTPIDAAHGTIKLWFMAGERQMTFTPAYHFSGKVPTGKLIAVTSKNSVTNVASATNVSEAAVKP